MPTVVPPIREGNRSDQRRQLRTHRRGFVHLAVERSKAARQQKKHMTSEQHAQLMATVVNITKAALNLTDGPIGRLDGALLRQQLREIAGIDVDTTSVVQLRDATNDLARA